MLDRRFKEAIKIICSKLDKNKIRWALIGSTNMAFQGMDVKQRDLDIIVHFNDLKKMKKIFSEYGISEIRELKALMTHPAWEVKFILNGIEVQILGENDEGDYVMKLIANRVVYLDLNGIRIPCFTLEAEEQKYRETNREKKANMIREFLRKK